jgi:hypothetical protein
MHGLVDQALTKHRMQAINIREGKLFAAPQMESTSVNAAAGISDVIAYTSPSQAAPPGEKQTMSLLEIAQGRDDMLCVRQCRIWPFGTSEAILRSESGFTSIWSRFIWDTLCSRAIILSRRHASNIWSIQDHELPCCHLSHFSPSCLSSRQDLKVPHA